MLYLCTIGVLLQGFAAHSLEMTALLKEAVIGRIEKRNRPVIYLQSSTVRKDDKAREIARRDNLTEGTICLLTCVEPCRSYQVVGNRETKKLELTSRIRKCLFLYHYLFHSTLGFMHVRIQPGATRHPVFRQS